MKDFFRKVRLFNIVPYLIIFYAVGIAGIIIPQSRDLFIGLVPLNLLLNLLLLFIYHGKIEGGFWWKVFLIFSAGIFIEVLGVHTGVIFGTYEYGPTLGLKIFDTPIIIGANWLMLVYSSLYISSKFIDKRYFRVMIAAVMMVVYDFALEPVAVELNMWSWGGAIPLQNYLAWLIVSFILIWFADWSGIVNKKNRIAASIFFVQLGFFIILNFWIFLR